MIKKFAQLAPHENLIAGIVFLISIGIYRTTMCPTVSFTDSGELATVATTLGIAHPTGYPLWTLIGRLSVMLPFGDQEIVRLNTLASFLTALAVSVFFKLVLVLYRSQRVFKFKRERSDDGSYWIPIFSAFVTALTLGFSSTIWAQSVEIEVYAIHALLVTVTMILFISGIEDQLSEPHGISRRLFLFSFILGLSFANHMTIVLLAPGFLYLFFVSLGVNKRSWQLIVSFVPFFLLGLSVYLYLPLRSASGPLMDWGHPVTLERFWWHVSGKQYQTWMFAGLDVVKKQLQYFTTNFPTEFHWLVIAFLFVGMIETFNRSKRLIVFLTLLFVTCLAYSVNFDIHEIDPYFMLAYLACGCVVGIAAKCVMEWSSNRNVRYSVPVAIVILISLPVIQVIGNRGDVDQSENYQAADFVRNVFSQLEPNAVVFSSLWDYFVSPSYYYQIVRKERPDVIIIDEELLKNRTWYFIQLEREHPEILEGSEEKASAFLSELNKFEKGEPFDFATINRRWEDLLADLVVKSFSRHPVYVDPRIVDGFSKDFETVPEGLLVRVTKKGEKTEWKPITGKFRMGTFNNYVTSDLKRYYSSMYTFHTYWLITQKRLPEALENIQEALRIDPTYSPALILRTRLSVRPG